MPTIVTDIVNEIFRSQKRKQGFAQKLKEIPVASESEVCCKVSDGESLGSQSTISRASNASYASGASVASDFGTGMPKEEYFMWGIELSRSRDSTVLKLDEVNDSEERHMLLLKQAVLGVNAIKGERNLVEIHTTDFEDKEQRHPLVSLTLGQQDFANLDLCLNWGKTKEIKLKLILGSGPISITGNHYVEYMEMSEEEDPDYVATETEDETDADLSMIDDVDQTEVDDLHKDAVQEVKTMNGENSKRKQPLNEDKISPAKKKAKDGEKKC